MRTALVFPALGAFGFAVATIVACTADKPAGYAGYCDPAPFAALMPDAAAQSPCASCLSANCCDAYGAATSTREGALAVSAEFECLVGEGSLAKTESASCQTATDSTTQPFFTCAESQCANECNLAAVVCEPNPTTPQILTADCDSCVASSCCSELNWCASSRACALTFQCILGCTNGDASALVTVFDNPEVPAVLACAEPIVCGTEVDAGGGNCNSGTIPTCFQGCIEQYAIEDTANGKTTSSSASCLAIELFRCSADHCAGDCDSDPTTSSD